MQSKQDSSVYYSIDVMSWYVMHIFIYTYISKYINKYKHTQIFHVLVFPALYERAG